MSAHIFFILIIVSYSDDYIIVSEDLPRLVALALIVLYSNDE